MMQTQPAYQIDLLTQKVIGCAVEVHRTLGPGMMESIYRQCMAFELREHGFTVEEEVAVPVSYKGVNLECGYRIDLLINKELILELKAVAAVLPVHEAQLMTYMKLANISTGLLINFHKTKLTDGVKRFTI